jgi:hypothetical protein
MLFRLVMASVPPGRRRRVGTGKIGRGYRSARLGARAQTTGYGINMLYPGGFQGTLKVIRAPHFQNFSFERKHPYTRSQTSKAS